ncbi:MAG: prolyl oligopeptidase family serine peptidase [Acidobacteriota bacterium]|nr:prolyl oligopeptidase family serine peptidase [Acidobacteriota bacterium]
MRCFLAGLLCSLSLAAAGQPWSIERLFTRPFIWGTPPSEVTWSHDGHMLAFLWNAEGQPFLDLYTYNPDTRKLTRLTDFKSVHDDLNQTEAEKDERLKRYQLPQTGVSVFDLSRDGARAALAYQGDLYLIPTDAHEPPFRLTKTKLPEASPQFSPDGRRLAYLRSGQLFTQELSTGQLTQVADADNITGYKWSPDGKRILYSTRSATPGRQLVLPIYSGRLVTARPFPRNLAGDEPGQSKSFTVAADGAGASTALDAGPWGARVWSQGAPQWSPDSHYLIQAVIHPDMKREQVLLLDAHTGKAKVLHEAKDAAWVNGMALGWSPDSKTVWFTSDEDGYQHLYTVPVSGGKVTQLTRGKWEIHREQSLYPEDPQWIGDWLYYSSTEPSPSERQFFRVKPDGSSKERLSEGEGIRIGVVSNDGAHRAVLAADLDHPLELTVDGRPITHRATPEFAQYSWPSTRFYTFPSHSGKQTVAGKMLLPAGYQPGEGKHKWPAVFFIHGSGYATSVLKQWGSYQEYRYVFNSWLANHGYVVFDIDYRGSSGYGRDWRTGVYLDMGGPDLQDVLGTVDYARSLGNIDMHRCGIWGVSYGGFMTDMALFRSPGTFQAGAAFASVTEWENYNAFYTQQRLNRPQDNPEAYRRSSPITFAGQLKDPLLIVHGMADSNVLFQDDVQLTEKLVHLNNPNFSEIFYPEENHGFAREESLIDSFRRTAEFFDLHLKAAAK